MKGMLLTICVFCLLFTIPIVEAEDSGSSTVPTPGPGMGQGRGMGRNMPTFAEFDLDGNGYLLEEEFIEARTKRIEARAKEGRMMRGLSNMMQFQDLDQDGDGKVTPDEFEQGVMAHRQKQFQ